MGGQADRSASVAAFEAARAAGDVDAMATTALALAREQRFGTQLGRVPAFLHQAYSLAHGQLRIRLAVALARLWVYGAEPARAVPFAREAVSAAEQAGDDGLLAAALDAQLLVHWGPDDLAERLRITTRIEDTVAHLPDPEVRMTAHLWRLTTALESLDLVTVRRQLRALDDLAAETGSARARFFAASRRAMHALLVGDTAGAARLTDETAAAGAEADEADTEALVHQLTAQRARQQDDRAVLGAEAAAFEEFGTAEGVPSITADGAALWLAAGQPQRARALLDGLSPLGGLPRDVDWLLTVSVLTEVAAATGASAATEEGLALLTPYAGRGVVNGGGVVFVGVVDDVLRVACAALGRADEASRWAAGAAAAYQRIGASWCLGRLATPTDRPAAAETVAHLWPAADGVWTVGTDGRTSAVRAVKGFAYLRLLLERPGVDVPAADLSAAVAGHAGVTVADDGLGEVVDTQALAAYRRRITDLDEELARAREWFDEARVYVITAERDALLEEISAATGLGGRIRRAGSSAERARVAVTKAIAAAVARVADVDPALGRYLRDAVRTGASCGYDPDPSRPVRWVLRGRSG